ncbi:aryl-alcohol dehydrogenase-like predicted oxidoreductase [Catenulispora sp. GP43]|uniref:aldo/keto reductase n=1 Tax=Catenulispora sp. GP43 TaxID=3156263 RepID=UPI00351183EC
MNREAGVIGLGAWQLGSDWGHIDDAQAEATLHAALDAGVTFIDTADMYGDGRSEQLIGKVLGARRDEGITVATKMGRRIPPHPDNFTLENFRKWTDRSRSYLGVDVLDLVQLHTPPEAVFHSDAVFDALDALVAEGGVAAYGASVETCDQALAAVARPGVAAIQIIVNALRLKPLEKALPAARQAGVGVIVRLPLASGLLSGKYDASTEFDPSDHRAYNRHGEAFDIGETFSGVDFEAGLEAVRRFAPLLPASATMAQFALRWLLDQPEVTVVIPGARNPEQAAANAAAADLEPLSAHAHAVVREVYDELIRPQIHDRW